MHAILNSEHLKVNTWNVPGSAATMLPQIVEVWSEHLKINRFDLKCEIRTFMITWVKSIDFSKIYKGKYFQTLNAFF